MQAGALSSKPVRVYVGSKNPVKINAARLAVEKCFPGAAFECTGIDAPSGVPAQPFGDEETLRGARNRVARLRESLLSPPAAAAPPPPQVESASTSAAVSGSGEPRLVPSGAAAAAAAATASRSGMLVAVEGGIARRRHDGLLECFAWVAVMSLETGAESTARSASFALPRGLVELMEAEGLELGAADDKFFGRTNSKQQGGTIGQLSQGVLTRQLFYEQAVTCALLPFISPHLYGEEHRLQ